MAHMEDIGTEVRGVGMKDQLRNFDASGCLQIRDHVSIYRICVPFSSVRSNLTFVLFDSQQLCTSGITHAEESIQETSKSG